MSGAAVLFLLLAVVTGGLAFAGLIVGFMASLMKVLFVICVVLFIAMLVKGSGGSTGNRPTAGRPMNRGR